MNETTLLVSQLAGPILVVMAFGILLNMKYFRKLANDVGKSPLLMVIGGMAAMLVGLAIVLNHNIWSTPQEIVVSLFGWLSLVKGVAYLLVPTVLGKIAKAIMSTTYLVVASILALALGGYLSWVGFFA